MNHTLTAVRRLHVDLLLTDSALCPRMRQHSPSTVVHQTRSSHDQHNDPQRGD